MRKIAGGAALVAVLVAGSMLPARAELITNGSFEDGTNAPNPPGGNRPVTAGSTDITGWTVSGGVPGDGLIWIANGGFGLTTPFGDRFVDLTGYADRTGTYFTVSQNISTVAGNQYTLTFDLGVQQNGGAFSGPISVLASAGDTSATFTDNPAPPGGDQNIYSPFSLTFIADGPTTTISFAGLTGNQYIGLDNVSVEGIAGAIPEPSTWAMMILGFAGMGFTAYRRRKLGAVTI